MDVDHYQPVDYGRASSDQPSASFPHQGGEEATVKIQDVVGRHKKPYEEAPGICENDPASAHKFAPTNYCQPRIHDQELRLRSARRDSRRAFSWSDCPLFRLSGIVQRTLEWREETLVDFLTRNPIHRTLSNITTTFVVEYDILHFKAGDIDEMLPRKFAHHDIAQALKKLKSAEDKINADQQGDEITFALADAQIILLISHLRAQDYSMNAYYDQRHAEEGLDPAIFDKPSFVRIVSDPVIVSAWKSLRSNLMVFGIRKEGEEIKDRNTEAQNSTATAPADTFDPSLQSAQKKEAQRLPDRHWLAFAYFQDTVVEGKLGFHTEVVYHELESGPDEVQLREQGLSREEGRLTYARG